MYENKQVSLDTIDEALTILQEECAEVIQEVSKVKRFGFDNTPYGLETNRDKLQKEVGDVLALVDYLFDNKVIDKEQISKHKTDKINKLKIYSNLYG